VVRLNELGEIVEQEWQRAVAMRREIDMDVFVVMPNHLHAIVMMTDANHVGAHGRAPLHNASDETRLHRPPRSLGSFIAAFKAASTRKVNVLRGTPGERFWQRNYYERIIRNERELYAVREYVTHNPLAWDSDPERPATEATIA